MGVQNKTQEVIYQGVQERFFMVVEDACSNVED